MSYISSITSQWCKPTVLKLWTLFGLEEAKMVLRNRTNCALECYNRHFNDLFPNAHPTLILFANVLFDEATSWIQLIRDRMDVSSIISEYEVASPETLPRSYANYKPKKSKSSPKRRFNKTKNAAHKKACMNKFVESLEDLE